MIFCLFIVFIKMQSWMCIDEAYIVSCFHCLPSVHMAHLHHLCDRWKHSTFWLLKYRVKGISIFMTFNTYYHLTPQNQFYLYFYFILFYFILSKLYAKHGAPNHNLEIESCVLYRLSQPGALNYTYISISSTFIYLNAFYMLGAV